MKLLPVILTCFVLMTFAACGGDDSKPKGSHDDAGSTGSRDAGASSSDSSAVSCGAKTCKVPADSIYQPCCRDQFASECGTLVGTQCRRERADVDTRCPLPDLPGIADAGMTSVNGVSACCTPSNECGLDLGLGTGCQSNVGGCGIFPPGLRDKLAFITCDGDPIDVPEECKSDSMQ